MPVADTVIAAVAAGGGLGGLAALISALRKPSPNPSPAQPPRPAAHTPPAWRRQQISRTAEHPAGNAPSWSLAAAACTCGLAGALVAVVGTTRMALGQIPVVLLVMATTAAAGLTMWISGRLLWRGVSRGQPDIALYAAAGLVMALGALAAALIAGSG